MFLLALVLGLSIQPPVVVCVGFTAAPCDFTYATPEQTTTDGDDLRQATILVTRDQDGRYSPTDVTTAIEQDRRAQEQLIHQLQQMQREFEGPGPHPKLLIPNGCERLLSPNGCGQPPTAVRL
jgi:hypothetical protein